ncbi:MULTISPECIES: tetratricopeptide repeat protein [Megasphaera]|mgnify:FL=1|uniref:Tetratricopeptide repeat protein n=1 Tax=Megasphaera hexanoica TaxID=1675036 RepID=A0A848BQG8_9FIRM|nr:MULTISPECIES: tetratricopeptide repeat protein [Megasphaera]NME27098.1 tetratricopeptide repeat protein [Megasphaera hexanoica]
MKKIPIAVALCLAVGLFIAGCGNQEQPAPAQNQQQQQQIQIDAASEALFEKGLSFYQQFQYDQAISLYDQALAKDQKNYKALSGKGIALAMRGNGVNPKEVRQGISLIRQALELKPDYVPSFYDLALALKIDKQYDESITWFQKVIDSEPDNTWSYYGIATIYGDQGNAEKAVLYLKKAAAIDKENVKEAARSQSHFDRIRNTRAFQGFMNQ